MLIDWKQLMNKRRPLQLVLYVVLAANPGLAGGLNSPDPARGSHLMSAGMLRGTTAPTETHRIADAQVLASGGIPEASLAWQGPARLEHGVARLRRSLGGTRGTLTLSDKGVDFRPEKGSSLHWPFFEIQTADLWSGRLILTSYERRGKFRPGVRRYRFDLAKEMPPTVAAEFVARIGRPVRNGNPERHLPGFAEIPARHRTAFGGTVSNGILRIHEGGIEYVSKSHKDSRNWRWGDIQEITNQDPYHLIVFGYRETYSFDLKGPLPPGLYDRLTDEVYDHNFKNQRGSGK